MLPLAIKPKKKISSIPFATLPLLSMTFICDRSPPLLNSGFQASGLMHGGGIMYVMWFQVSVKSRKL